MYLFTTLCGYLLPGIEFRIPGLRSLLEPGVITNKPTRATPGLTLNQLPGIECRLLPGIESQTQESPGVGRHN